jgi:cell division septum initiation protein DivIVA
MAENSMGSRGLENSIEADAVPAQGDRQATLLKLAERTVLQAEALAQEITENARKASEAEGIKILAQYTEQAKAEANQTIESAQTQGEAIHNQATAAARTDSEKMLSKAQADGEKMLSKAQADSEKMLRKAQTESDDMLSKAQSDKDEGLSKAQSEAQEILGRAQQDAQAVINASQIRADSTESKSRLKAEFMIRQTTQSVADGVRSAVLETCNNLLVTLEEFGNDAKELPVNNPVGRAVANTPEARQNTGSNGTDESTSSPDSVLTDTETDSFSMQPAGKVKKNGVA